MTAVYLAILSSKTTQKLSTHISPVAIDAGLPRASVPQLLQAIAIGTPAAMENVPGINSGVEAAVGAELPYAYAAAYAYVYYAAMAVASVGLIACLFVKDYDPFLTNHVPRQIYNSTKSSPGTATPMNSTRKSGQKKIEKNRPVSILPQLTQKNPRPPRWNRRQCFSIAIRWPWNIDQSS